MNTQRSKHYSFQFVEKHEHYDFQFVEKHRQNPFIRCIDGFYENPHYKTFHWPQYKETFHCETDAEKMIQILKTLAFNSNERSNIFGIKNTILTNNDLICVNASIEELKNLKLVDIPSFKLISLEFSPIRCDGSHFSSILLSGVLVHVMKNLRIIDYCHLFACSKHLQKIREKYEEIFPFIAKKIALFIVEINEGVPCPYNGFISDENLYNSDDESYYGRAGIPLKESDREARVRSDIKTSYSHLPLILKNDDESLIINEKPDIYIKCYNHWDSRRYLQLQYSAHESKKYCLICHKRWWDECNILELKYSLKYDEKNFRILIEKDLYSFTVCDDCKCYNIPKLTHVQYRCKLIDLYIPYFFTFHIKNEKEAYFRDCCANCYHQLGYIDQKYVYNESLDFLKQRVNARLWNRALKTNIYPTYCTQPNCDNYTFAHLKHIHFAVGSCPLKNKCKNTKEDHRQYYFHPTQSCKHGSRCNNNNKLHRYRCEH